MRATGRMLVLIAALLSLLRPGLAASQPAALPGEACVELSRQLEDTTAALEAQLSRSKAESDAIVAEAAEITAAPAAQSPTSRAAREDLARRIDRHNARARAADAAIAVLNEQVDRYNAAVASFNAQCANRTVSKKERDAALAEPRAKPAAAAASPAPGVPAGPFEAGVAAYDAGDFQRAFALWAPLAEQGNPSAQFNLGTLYEQGRGVDRNEATAAAWFLKAAERGDVQAQVKLAGWYESGTGVARDPARARLWYAAALARPDARAEDAALRQHAQDRLAVLTREHVARSEQAIPYEGGRFVFLRYDSNACIVALQGAVTASASYVFDDAIKAAAAAGCAKPTMLLESLGGSLLDGLSLGRRVRLAGLQTVARSECASACGLIFLGGVDRTLLGPHARIGFHQVASVRGQAQSRRCDASRFSPEMRQIRDYLRFVVTESADGVFDLIARTSCDSIEWVAGARAVELGVATRIDTRAPPDSQGAAVAR